MARASRKCCDACRERLLSVSFEVGGGENVPGISGTCATRHSTYLVRGPWDNKLMPPRNMWLYIPSNRSVVFLRKWRWEWGRLNCPRRPVQRCYFGRWPNRKMRYGRADLQNTWWCYDMRILFTFLYLDGQVMCGEVIGATSSPECTRRP